MIQSFFFHHTSFCDLTVLILFTSDTTTLLLEMNSWSLVLLEECQQLAVVSITNIYFPITNLDEQSFREALGDCPEGWTSCFIEKLKVPVVGL